MLEKGRTRFVGYEHLEAHARVIGLLVDQQPVDSIEPGTRADLVLDETPFYAETGGQVGDQGALYSEKNEKLAAVETVYPAVPGLSVHRIVAHARIQVGDELWARVDDPVRHATMRNHTATHLLHASLRKVLGPHVKQAGSVVAPDRLRFDFTHYTAMDHAEMQEVERLMNHEVLENIAVDTEVMPLDVAVSTGAMALFGEKYGDRVRVVSIPGFSKELCGGTHVSRTGDIGVCKIVYESSISAGVRRIEAITGEKAVEQYQHTMDALNRLAHITGVSEPDLVDHVEKLLARERSLEKQVEQLKNKLAQSAAADLEGQARTVKNVRVLAARLDGMDRQQLRALADSLRNKWKTAVVVLASAEDSNVSIISAVTKDLTGKVHAGKLVGTVAQAVGGKGGGRPDMAEGGGKDPGALRAALEQVYTDVESKL
jgi:alanyl-tRNA synthetase